MLIGLGLGPGNPELLTLRAVRLLKEADTVFVPGRIAYDLVAPYRDADNTQIPDDRRRIPDPEVPFRECREDCSCSTAMVLRFSVFLATRIFSPHSHGYAVFWQRNIPLIEYRTEPGISSITAFAAAAGISLNGGFTVSDGPEPDSRILLKVKHPKEKADELRREGYREFVLVERMYFADMKVYRNDDLPDKSDYLSVMYARR